MPAGHESQTGWPPPPLGAVPPFQKILNEVDPHQELSEAQRYKLAKSAWNEHLSRMRFMLMRKRSKAKVGLAVDGGSAPEDSEGDPSSGSPTPPAPQGTAPTHLGPPDHIADPDTPEQAS